MLFSLQDHISQLLALVLLVVKVFALVDCARRAPAEFSYRDTLPKNSWLVILVLAVLGQAISFGPLGLLSLIGTVAALVYLAQLRGSR